MSGIARLLVDVDREARASLAEWGEEVTTDGTGGLEAERAADVLRGEVARAFAEERGTWRALLMVNVLEAFALGDPAFLREELLGVAGMAVAWVADLDMRHGNTPAPPVLPRGQVSRTG